MSSRLMQIASLYLVMALAFVSLDAIGIRYVIRPIFEAQVGHLLATPMRLGPAALFYAGYIAGVLWFVALPALRSDEPMAALVGGVLLGLLCYGTYEFTNFATLAAWSWRQVIVDTLWGGILTGFTAWVGVTVMMAFRAG